tara:strand:+ start:1278 stop:1946 length:669 start_codon:yes stop_codon:yes gene_type:complete
MENKVNKLSELLNIKFNNTKLLLQAITHKSFDSNKNYELLEFLGDRVLGLVISNKLIEIFPDEKVGILDKKFASLVNKNKCYEVGKNLMLNKFILIGNLNKKSQIIENKIISDSCESLIGAIYLDKGFDIAKKFILKNWGEYLNSSVNTIIDPKTKLQEYALKKFKTLPVYKVISTSGPKHKPNFKVGVKIKNTKIFYSIGSSKRNAEQLAANELLKSLNLI